MADLKLTTRQQQIFDFIKRHTQEQGYPPTVNNVERQAQVGFSVTTFIVSTKFIAKKSSNLKTLNDLKGKTVGALLGGDPYNVLAQMLRLELGNADPKAHGITVVNTPTQAQAATIPTGMDAAILIHPAFLKAQADFVDQTYDIVLMTIGGNDVHFSTIVKRCFVVHIRDGNVVRIRNRVADR